MSYKKYITSYQWVKLYSENGLSTSHYTANSHSMIAINNGNILSLPLKLLQL